MGEKYIMKTKYSIGKVAKIHNMTIESLRHYDRVGLLKPSYINEDTGYRLSLIHIYRKK